ncbi:MAG: phosphomannomutase [Myxococcota bacterium]|jgi:phosphomannomutase
MHKFHKSILRAYDIRGVIDETLSNKDAYYIGRSFAKFLKDKKKVVIGYDGRISSPDLKESLVQGLIDSGVDVLEVGLCPTPMLYFAVHYLKADAGIMITGSHNPANHNGFKFALKERPFYGDDILGLGKIVDEGEFPQGSGDVKFENIMDDYIDHLANDCCIESDSEFLDELDEFLHDKKPLKISWDIGNGATGVVTRKLTDKLKAQHFLLFEEIDGSFPNHHPDPTVEENLEDLKKSVAENGCAVGIAFDGDGDRLGVVDDLGEVMWGDQMMCLFARDVLKDHPGATIIADVKASQVLFDQIKEFGGKPLMWKTGHSLIKAKMKETGAPLAGEMSGHIFFADRYFGFDDGIYAAIRLINIIIREGKPLSEIRKSIPKTFSTPEIRINCLEEEKFAIVDSIKLQLQTKGIEFNDIDGVRVQTSNGWWLLRASNTGAILVARCEALSKDHLDRLKKDLRELLTINDIMAPKELD